MSPAFCGLAIHRGNTVGPERMKSQGFASPPIVGLPARPIRRAAVPVAVLVPSQIRASYSHPAAAGHGAPGMPARFRT
jgi:hypothetical protein